MQKNMIELEISNRFGQTWSILTRKKPISKTSIEKSDLPRVLNLVDLTALGVASTLGMGVYVMAGSIAKIAGPAACISFFISGIAATLSALCYAEFAARVPKAGSAYVYSYVAIGEFVAFIVGWNIVLEYVIGTACVARALGGYIDSLIDNQISKYLIQMFPIDHPYFSSYLDFFSFFIMVCFSCVLGLGVILSSNFNKFLTVLNLTTVSIVVLAGVYKGNFHNWSLKPEDVHNKTNHGGAGGFLPFGYISIFTGAAKCFYAYTGFDCVATTGDEAKNPKLNVPLALILTLCIAFVAYLGISVSLTLMWPYYDQSATAPFPYAFEHAKLDGLKWVVTVGSLCALCACLVGSIYSMSRIVYSMANDGLLYQSLSLINKRFQTPLFAIAVVGLFTGFLSILFDIDMLVDMTSIGTLTAYTLVSICVLLLRYENKQDKIIYLNKTMIHNNDMLDIDKNQNNSFNKYNKNNINKNSFSKVLHIPFRFLLSDTDVAPTENSTLIVKWMILFLLTSLITLCACITRGYDYLSSYNSIVLAVFVISILLLIISYFIITRQPQSREQLHFKVRFVPLLPVISIAMNISLMMLLNLQTWIRFIVWMIFGFIIYFSYGIKHSKERSS